MTTLQDCVAWCNERVRLTQVKDFPPAENGLQIENNGRVTKIGAAVDAGLIPFQKSAQLGIDFLIVHHGLYWNNPKPLTAHNYRKIKSALDNNLAVYSSHLPLDAHPEIGNNALIAAALGLNVVDWFLPYEGVNIGAIAEFQADRSILSEKLKKLFPSTFQSMEFGSKPLHRIAIASGSGQAALEQLRPLGIDTLITGELRQQHYNLAQELALNLYPCGHYATETFGVKALASELAKKMNLPWEFISMDCPL